MLINQQEGNTIIYCINGHKDIVELLLNMKNIDVNKPEKDGATPLRIALQ